LLKKKSGCKVNRLQPYFVLNHIVLNKEEAMAVYFWHKGFVFLRG
jgi:hypothetical protein